MRELRQQLTNALLMIVTVAAVIAAAINFQQQSKFHLPDDGVTWVDRLSGRHRTRSVSPPTLLPEARRKRPGSTKATSWFRSTACRSIGREEAAQVLARLGSWHKAEYKILHDGTEVPAQVIIGEVDRDSTLYYQYAVGVLYLAIGLFVYFRRGSAPRAAAFFPAVPGLLRLVDVPLHRAS